MRVSGNVIGLDVSDKYTQVCVLDGAGDVIAESRVRTTREGLSEVLESRSPARVALEVGGHSPWISRLLTSWGHNVIIANPRQVRLISESGRKNDRIDAEMLARLARLDPKLLHAVQHRSEEKQADLAVIRARETLVRSRTRLISHVRGSVKAVGARVPASDASTFHRKAAGALPPVVRPALEPVLAMIEQLTAQIREYDRKIEKLARTKYSETERLIQVPGIGPLTALAYALVIDEPRRFSTSRKVGAYLGLCPRQYASGESDPQMRISRAGNGLVRRLLVQAAHYQLGSFGPDTDLRRWGLARAQRGGRTSKKRAVIAVARRNAVLLHRLWISGETYEPLRGAELVAA